MEHAGVLSLSPSTTTPRRSPSSPVSHRSREYEDLTPASTPPPPMASEEKAAKRRSRDADAISPLDPRRFTPTLHASLVSEILNLRRDLEGKTKDIDHLEQSLHAAQAQNEGLNKKLLQSNRDVRSFKTQMQLLEGETLSAINELSEERDKALADAAEIRRRHASSQKKARNDQLHAERLQKILDKERETWTAERRNLETKIHVTEGRLKTVLNEVANAQAEAAAKTTTHSRSQSQSSKFASPGKRPLSELRDRRQSVVSNGSDQAVGGRTSVLSFTQGISATLADELGLEDIEEDRLSDDDEDAHGRVSPDALPEERDRPASSLSLKARKVLGLPFDIDSMGHSSRREAQIDPASPVSAARPARYVDTGTQYIQPFSASNEIHTTPVPELVAHTPAVEMISASSQTLETVPSPLPTAIHGDGTLTTIPESAFERGETKAAATQTDVATRINAHSRYTHSRTSTDDLGVPVISIIPPTSRPATPTTNIVLPPRTKSAGTQVSFPTVHKYTSASMQTEEIRIDPRTFFSLSGTITTGAAGQLQSSAPKPATNAHTRKTTVALPASNTSQKRTAAPASTISQTTDPSLQNLDSGNDMVRPVRTSSMSAGFGDSLAGFEDELEDDVFDDDDLFSRPTAKFTLRSGRLISERVLRDISELTAASAGQALAMDKLRQSEDILPPELRQLDVPERQRGSQRSTTVQRGQSTAARSGNIRRTAMISNGTAAHQKKYSQSSMDSSETGVAPPIPIPLRYSSARVPKSFSEGGRSSRGSSNNSPTRQGRHRVQRPGLRKARSGPANSPAAQATRRRRSVTPPDEARISIIPDMPMFQMPAAPQTEARPNLTNIQHEASAPRPSVATGPSRTHHSKANSDAAMIQQTSVIDAIAQTMVGEWMFKYVRRRKSFGKPEKEWDPSKSADELINNPSSAGVRHKRWVWVAPYERAIMWSNKQPTTGAALMGKSGRKLTIKSVLDIKDDNPMPKGSVSGSQFNRSIIILTPERALKFTATSQERHYVWLAALSFLSHSPISIGELASLPPPPEQQSGLTPPSTMGGSFRRRNIRDSIRLAKGSSRIGLPSFTTDGSGALNDLLQSRPATREFYDATTDAALPPVVKRYHLRNRSNTAPKAPPSAFKSMLPNLSNPQSGPPSSHYSQSNGTDRISSERGPYTPSFNNTSIPSSRRGSEASALGRPPPFDFSTKITPQFFDSNASHNASMTMRMDAFIDNKHVPKNEFKNLRLADAETRGGARVPDLPYWGLDPPNASPVDNMFSVEPTLRCHGTTNDRDLFRGF